MSDNHRQSELSKPKTVGKTALFLRTRWALGGLLVGMLPGTWIGGGTDRYGDDEGVLGGLRGTYVTMARSYHYSVATIRDCMYQNGSSVRKLGLVRQIENRIWQDKRLAAEAIVVGVEDDGKVVLTGQVPDPAHKERAVELARNTRGVETVVDQLAVALPSRTIDAASSPPVPTGVASGAGIVR